MRSIKAPPGSVFLCVPSGEKDRASALGARWDEYARRWFVPLFRDVSRLSKWLDNKPPYADLAPANADADELIESPVALKLILYRCYRCANSTLPSYATDHTGIEITDDLYRPEIISALHLFREIARSPGHGYDKAASVKTRQPPHRLARMRSLRRNQRRLLSP
jgi:hypothetical protein